VIRRPLLLAALAAALTAAASCGEDRLTQLCTDAACVASHDGNPHWYCQSPQLCGCANDDACAAGEHCNAADAGGDGRCHPDRLCEVNADCSSGEACGTDGVCRRGCVDDLQCNLGHVCDRLTSTCVPGCWSHADCALRSACVCDGDAGFCGCADPSKGDCPRGQCVTGVCPDKTFCDYGELCQPDARGIPRCVKDDRGRYCVKCRRATGDESNLCDSPGPDFCLVDTSDPTRRGNFCGVDCDEGQECPNGYACHDILRLTQQICSGSSQCAPTPYAPHCSSDDDCPSGARCTGGGVCAGSCVIRESAASGFCSCVVDDECPQDSCGSDRRCNITRKPCTPGANDSCAGVIRCVNDGTRGYCRIGRNCTPDGGLNCAEIQAGVDGASSE
jgi:hypothetical protein